MRYVKMKYEVHSSETKFAELLADENFILYKSSVTGCTEPYWFYNPTEDLFYRFHTDKVRYERDSLLHGEPEFEDPLYFVEHKNKYFSFVDANMDIEEQLIDALIERLTVMGYGKIKKIVRRQTFTYKFKFEEPADYALFRLQFSEWICHD